MPNTFFIDHSLSQLLGIDPIRLSDQDINFIPPDEPLKQWKNFWLGKKHSEETKKQMSASSRGQIPWNKGKTWRAEQKAKLIEVNRKNAGNAAQVAKHWSITNTETNETFSVKNLKEWCRVNGISYNQMKRTYYEYYRKPVGFKYKATLLDKLT